MSEIRPYGETPAIPPDSEPIDRGIARGPEDSPEGGAQPIGAPSLPGDGGGATDDPAPDRLPEAETRDIGRIAIAGVDHGDPGGATDDPPPSRPTDTEVRDIGRTAVVGSDHGDPGGATDDAPKNGQSGPRDWPEGNELHPHSDDRSAQPESEDVPDLATDAEVAGMLLEDPEARIGTEEVTGSEPVDDIVSPSAEQVDQESVIDSNSENTQDLVEEGESAASRFEVGSTDRIPTGDSDTERAWSISEKVDAGRSFVAPGDDARETVEPIKPTAGQYSVIIHGNTETVGINHPDGNVQLIDPEKMANLIRSDPDWGGSTVRLVSCDTGKQPDDGSPAFAQDLADELNVDVVAPTDKVFVSNGQEWVSSTHQEFDPLTAEYHETPNSTAENPDGRWETFVPRQ